MIAIDLESYVGQTVNSLKVERLLPANAHGDRKYQVTCVCGTELSIGVYNIIRGNSKSCGCLIKNGYLRQTDEKLTQAYLNNQRELTKIKAAFVARNLPEPTHNQKEQHNEST